MFELSVPIDGIEESDRHHTAGRQDMDVMMQPPRTLLPHRSGEPRLAPRQYFYPASKTGVVPSWRYAM